MECGILKMGNNISEEHCIALMWGGAWVGSLSMRVGLIEVAACMGGGV